MRVFYVHPQGQAGARDADLLADSQDMVMCAGRSECLTMLREESQSDEPPHLLVVIDRAVNHPLSVARAARDAHPQVQLAVVAAADDVEQLREKTALSPGISDADVIPFGEDDLEDRIRRVAGRTRDRQRVQGALDEMNLELRQRQLDRRTAPAQPSVSERHLSALTRHAPDAIISVDTTGSIASWNPAATRIFGYDAEQTEGADLSGLLSRDGQTTLADMVREAADGSAQTARDLELRRDDGRPVTAAVTAAPVCNSHDEVVGVVVIARDVTEQRRTDEQLRHLQKAQSLATLAGGVAHDFNNLLVSVQGWSELALEEPDNRELVQEALGRIRESAGQASDLARQMLAYSGRTTVRFEAVDVNDIVTEMVDLLGSSVSKQFYLDTSLDSPLPTVQADPTQLRQIVMNLVTNAAEALGEDPGRIEIRTFTRDVDPDATAQGSGPALEGLHVVLSVTDTGPGMDAETAQRVFEPFFTTKFTGRGLGLAASLGIAQAHGGTIEVEAEPGAGARFDVLLPAGPVESSGEATSRRESA